MLIVYRIFTAVWFHLNLLHIFLNMMTFEPMGASIERKVGSFHLIWSILLFSLLNGIIHLLMAVAAYNNPFYSYSKEYFYTCTIGFSGVLFSLLMITVHQSDTSSRRFFISLRFSKLIFKASLGSFRFRTKSILGHCSSSFRSSCHPSPSLGIFLAFFLDLSVQPLSFSLTSQTQLEP